jgi:hypothetical protein
LTVRQPATVWQGWFYSFLVIAITFYSLSH